MGLEGVVSKRADRPYRSGRREDWLKTKCTDREEFVVAGYVPSTATRRAVGSLVLGYYRGGRLVHAGQVGTGFSETLARSLRRWLDAGRRDEPPFAERLAAPGAARRRLGRAPARRGSRASRLERTTSSVMPPSRACRKTSGRRT